MELIFTLKLKQKSSLLSPACRPLLLPSPASLKGLSFATLPFDPPPIKLMKLLPLPLANPLLLPPPIIFRKLLPLSLPSRVLLPFPIKLMKLLSLTFARPW